MADSELTVKLDPSMVTAYIQTAMVTALGKDPEALVRAVVDAAMTVKRNYGEHKTVFQEAMDMMIREVARDAFKEWLEGKKTIIRQAIENRLKEGGDKFVADVSEKLVAALSENFYVHVSLKVED